MARSTNGRSSFALGNVVTIRSSRELISDVARLRNSEIRCSVVRPSFRCAFKCRIELLFNLVVEVAQVGSVASARTRNGITLFVELHTEIETHTIQDILDLVQRLLAKILGGQHLALGPLHEIANGTNVSIFQAVVGPSRQLELVH